MENIAINPIISQEDVDKVTAVLIKLADAIIKLADAIIEAAKVIVKAVTKACRWIYNIVKKNINYFACKTMLSKREFHLSQYAKKLRVRKKYKNLAFRRLCHGN